MTAQRASPVCVRISLTSGCHPWGDSTLTNLDLESFVVSPFPAVAVFTIMCLRICFSRNLKETLLSALKQTCIHWVHVQYVTSRDMLLFPT